MSKYDCWNAGLPCLVVIFVACQTTFSQTASTSRVPSTGNSTGNPTNDTFLIKMKEICKNISFSETADLQLQANCARFNVEDTNCTVLPPPSFQDPTHVKPATVKVLMNDGSKTTQAFPQLDEAILILGNTGSGKTTLAQILTGNLSHIHAVKTQSGSLVIVDDADRIGAPSTVSKTLLPELNLLPGNNTDNSTPTAFYDCPGFDDTRGVEQDIAANFFIQQILRKVARVKILFLVIYSSVKHGNDRLDFDLLAQHASKFVKNFAKYGNSVGLVVTKVSSYSDDGAYKSDKDIMNGIVEFLVTFNQTLTSALAAGHGPYFNRGEILGKINFVDALLQTNSNGEYSKISFLKSVDKCGPLIDSAVVSQSKARITLLYTRLESTLVDPRDFGYALKDKTSLSILKLIDRNNEDIYENVEKHVKRFHSWHEERDTEINNITLLLEQAETDLVHLRNLVGSMNAIDVTTNSSTTQFSHALTTHLKRVGFNVPENFTLMMERKEAIFAFFDEAQGSMVTRNVRTWALPLQHLLLAFSNERNWLEFCVNLRSRLFSYKFQSKKVEKAVAPPEEKVDWLEYVASKKIVPVSSRVRAVAPSVYPKHRKILGDLMKFALEPTESTCTGSNLTISGNFVVLSEFVNTRTGRLSRAQWNCSAEGHPTKLEVYASHSIFIDADLRMVGKEFNLVMIAPIWNVIGKRVLDLSGTNGMEIQPPRAADGSKTLAWWDFWAFARYMFDDLPGADGENGRPGNHGGHAGSFFGVVGKVGGKDLEILASGGGGGRGQDGGHGEKGGNGGGLLQEAHPGGKGGKGGIGGFGGMPGHLSLIALESAVSVKLDSKIGIVGEAGKNGSEGEGGHYHYPRQMPTDCEGKNSSDEFDFECDYYFHRMRKSAVGTDGVYNKTSNTRPEHDESTSYTINERRSILKFKGIFNSSEQNETMNFVQLMDRNTQIQKYFRVEAFATELMNLEEISFGEGADEEELRVRYKSLKDRIETFVEENIGKLSIENRKFLALLLASVSSKLVSFGKTLDFGKIPDYSFFTNLKEQLVRWQNISTMMAVDEIRTQIEKKIREKLEQAKWFRMEVVTNSVQSVEEKMGLKFEKKLESYILDHSNKVEPQIRHAPRQRQFLKVIQMVTTVLKLLGKLGNSTLRNEENVSLGTGALLGGSSGPFASSNPTNRKITNMKTWCDQTLEKNSSEGTSQDPDRNLAVTLFGQKVATSLYEKCGTDERKLGKLKTLIEEAELAVKALNEKTRVLKQILECMKTYFENIKSQLDSGELPSTSERDITKWEAAKALKVIKARLRSLTLEFRSTDIQRLADNVQVACTLMLDLYNNIEVYQDVKYLGEYMSALSSASMKTVRIGDPELARIASKLENGIRDNLLRREYRLATHTFTQYVFPFAKLELEKFRNASTRNISRSGGNDLVAMFLSEIDLLQSQLNMFGETISNGQDPRIIKTNFSCESPFFVWENKPFNSEIGQLLSGKKVYLRANVSSSHRERDAVKFSQIGINFKILAEKSKKSTPELEKNLRDELEHFSVSMTHDGLSTYKFRGGVFMMIGRKRTIASNFGRDSISGNHVGRNGIYNEFEREDFTLSPYATWTLQLKTVTANATIGFEKLKKFGSLVDVELVGSGVYVDVNNAELLGDALEVDKYYQSDESMYEELDF